MLSEAIDTMGYSFEVLSAVIQRVSVEVICDESLRGAADFAVHVDCTAGGRVTAKGIDMSAPVHLSAPFVLEQLRCVLRRHIGDIAAPQGDRYTFAPSARRAARDFSFGGSFSHALGISLSANMKPWSVAHFP